MDVNALFQIVTNVLNGGIKLDVFTIMTACISIWCVIFGAKLVFEAIIKSIVKGREDSFISSHKGAYEDIYEEEERNLIKQRLHGIARRRVGG